jgi:hypothetical protein
MPDCFPLSAQSGRALIRPGFAGLSFSRTREKENPPFIES